MTPSELQQAVQSMLQTLQSGNSNAARAQAEAILRVAPGEPNASQVLAMDLLQNGKAAEALPHLLAADEAAPNHPPILNMLGIAQKQQEQFSEARDLFKRACALDEKFIDARLNLAQLDLDEARLADAQKNFDAALSLQPDNGTALAGWARAALLQHDADAARKYAEKALAVQPGHTLAGLTLAAARLRLQDFSGALDVAAAMAARQGIGAVNRAYAAGVAADANDRLGQFDKAFAYYSQANEVLVDGFAHLKDVTASPFSSATIRTVQHHFNDHDLGPSPECPKDERSLAFLVGFPRSGTTLLEQVLMSHPKIESFGEHSTLMNACGDLYLSEDGLSRLDEMDEQEAATRRARYWEEIGALGDVSDDHLLLDKLPLNTVFLPVIAKVFPRAKILFALRDPRDVVLSCFQQRFGMNLAMYQLLSLESAARYYDEVMSIGTKARAMADFDLREVRYESVVADLEGEARRVIDFLGLEWDERVLNYREGARARAINTPSVAQVVEPIYTRSQGKWRSYEAHLASVLPTLAPWVSRFNYD
jgi:tetratricopeptide (TPR) repeat protein